MSGSLHSSCFNHPAFSDITIKFGTESVVAHRIVLARSSECLKKLLTAGFKEGGAKDIELKDDDPMAAKAMLRFIYNEEYYSGTSNAANWNTLASHANVYVVAEKYGLEALKETSSENLRTLLRSPIDTADLFRTLGLVWSSTLPDDDLLRPVFADHCASNLTTLADYGQLKQILRDTDLGADITLRLAHILTAKIELNSCGCKGQLSIKCRVCNQFSKAKVPASFAYAKLAL